MILSTLLALSFAFLTDTLATSQITASLKDDFGVTPEVSMQRLNREAVSSAKDASAIIPNFYQPDYGSRTTSSIYVRGFGSRIDQPAIGLYVDEIPILNKSNYDFDFVDIRSVKLLRGPQGTLYGRNASSGALIVRTMDPGSLQGIRLVAEYSPAAAGKLAISGGGTSKKGLQYSISAWGNYYDGDFEFASTAGENAGDKADRSLSAGLRSRTRWQGKGTTTFENILSIGYVKEGGYAYRQMDTDSGELLPLSYNDPSEYRRLSITDGFVVKGNTDALKWSAVASWQFLDDDMDIDNDFTDLSLYSMSQMQTENAFTFEGLIRRNDSKAAWQPLTGFYAFGKFLDLSAPVTFKQDGIDQLILANANAGISRMFPGESLQIKESEIVIASDFNIPAGGLAIFHNSSFDLGRWNLSAGLRVEMEATRMKYDSEGIMNFLFTMTMSDWRELQSVFKGSERQSFVEVLPSFEAKYSLDHATFHASVRRGHKAGGFNTQMFSDILQNILMTDMMSALGMGQTSSEESSANSTVYKPESAWDFEIGADMGLGDFLDLSLTAFWIDCRNQQVTVMPSGNSTGRMMSNAGHTRSYGLEASASFRKGGLYASADWGLSIAEFKDYQYSDEINYAGNRVPYAPANTLSSELGYRFSLSNGPFSSLDISANCKGAGKIWWDEANTLSQPFYCTFGTNVSLVSKNGKYNLSFWTRNLSDKEYKTFYFKSVSRSFYSMGRPLRMGLRLTCTIK